MIPINVAHKDTFDVWDSDGNPVTGLVQANFTVYIINPSGTDVTLTATWSITELQNGLYEISLTPSVEGRWTIKVIHTTYLPSGLHTSYQADDSTFDTIEDKVDLILEDTGITIPIQITSVHGNTDALITAETTAVETHVTNEHTTTKALVTSSHVTTDAEINANEAKIDIIDTNLDAVLVDTSTTIPAQITSSHSTTDANVDAEHVTTRTAISTTESNIRGADNDDLKDLSDQLDTLQAHTFVHLNIPEIMYLPTVGSSTYQMTVGIFDSEGNPEAPDEAPDITIINADNVTVVDGVNMTSMGTGQYYYNYDLAYDQPVGLVKVIIEVLEGGVTKTYRDYSRTANYGDVEAIAADVTAIKLKTDNLPDDTNATLTELLGLMHKNAVLTVLTKSATGKLLTGYLITYTDNTLSTALYVYDITATYDVSDGLTSYQMVIQ